MSSRYFRCAYAEKAGSVVRKHTMLSLTRTPGDWLGLKSRTGAGEHIACLFWLTLARQPRWENWMSRAASQLKMKPGMPCRLREIRDKRCLLFYVRFSRSKSGEWHLKALGTTTTHSYSVWGPETWAPEKVSWYLIDGLTFTWDNEGQPCLSPKNGICKGWDVCYG
jgi:hypothetical protein